MLLSHLTFSFRTFSLPPSATETTFFNLSLVKVDFCSTTICSCVTFIIPPPWANIMFCTPHVSKSYFQYTMSWREHNFHIPQKLMNVLLIYSTFEVAVQSPLLRKQFTFILPQFGQSLLLQQINFSCVTFIIHSSWANATFCTPHVLKACFQYTTSWRECIFHIPQKLLNVLLIYFLSYFHYTSLLGERNILYTSRIESLLSVYFILA